MGCKKKLCNEKCNEQIYVMIRDSSVGEWSLNGAYRGFMGNWGFRGIGGVYGVGWCGEFQGVQRRMTSTSTKSALCEYIYTQWVVIVRLSLACDASRLRILLKTWHFVTHIRSYNLHIGNKVNLKYISRKHDISSPIFVIFWLHFRVLGICTSETK